MNDSLELRITEREPFADGHSFEDAGPYERLVGRAHFAVDPENRAYADVVDFDKVPRNADGLVEYASDVCILKPAGPGKRRLLFGYGNRGNKRELQFFNDAPASNAPRTLRDAGNGFLMRRGYTVVWAAWEGDLLPGDGRMLLDVPVARDGAQPLTGLVRTEFIADRPGISTFPLSGWASTRSYPTVSLDKTRAKLTRRRYPGDAREPIASGAWTFARTEGGVGLDAQGAESALVESDTNIHVFDGFEPGWIYELVYTARDPRPYGVGHAVVRDLVSFLRYDDTDRRGAANPLAGAIDKAYAWGRSQTGRCIRDFVYRGYNTDARGPARLRRGDAARLGRRPDVDEPSLRTGRHPRRPAVRGPRELRGPIPLRVRTVNRPPARPRGRNPQAARDRPSGAAHPQRNRVLAAAWVARAHRYRGPRPRAPGQRPHLPVGQLAALLGSECNPTRARQLSALREHRPDVDAVSRHARRPRRVGHPWDRAPRQPDSAPSGRYPGRVRGVEGRSFRVSPAS